MSDLDERNRAIMGAIKRLKKLSNEQIIMLTLMKIIPRRGDIDSEAIWNELSKRGGV